MSWLVLLPLASILGYSAALVRRNLIGWSIAPISVISSIVLILFLSDFLSLLRPVSLCLTLAGVGLLFAEGSRYVKLNGYRAPSGFVWGCAAVGLATALLVDYNSNAQFVSWDMFSHWGTIIKLTEFTNTALDLKNQGYRLYFQDYPPGTAYLGYFFVRFTGFHENVAIFSHAILLMFAAMPAIAASNMSFRLHGLLLVIMTFIVILLMGQGWSSILIDQIVGVLFGSALSIYWVTRNNPKAWWALPPVFGFLVLAKDSGASFTVAAIALIVVSHWYRMRTAAREVAPVRGLWKTLLVCIVVPIVISQSWAGHVKSQALDRSLAGMSITSMLKQATHCCATEREQAILSGFAERMLGMEHGSLHGSAAGTNSLDKILKTRWDAPGKLVLALLLVGLVICVMQPNKVDRNSYGLLVIGVAAGGILYCCLMLLYYLYGFSDYEGRVLTSLERYFGSYALGMAFLLLAGAATLPFDSRVRKMSGIALFAALIVPSLVLGRTSIQPYLWSGGPEYFPTRDELVTPLVHPFVDKTYPRVSVLVVWQADKPSYVGLEYWILRYELTPRTTQAGGCFSFGPPQYAGDTTTCNWSEEEFVRALGNYHYVFVGNGLQSLQRAYPSVFEDGALPGNSGVLSVKQFADGTAKLKQWQP
ncbi:hypothetical protein [Pseudomonas sp. MYb118]|uniref:hypothetical protein n=1 Tax=Pseudomonas sp. MYb118 TaxID=1848720 RepID=UPI0034CE90B3